MRRIRPLALALIRRGDDILVEEGWDEVKKERFFRLLGGEIEFGERGADTVRRELREELGAECDGLHQVAGLENLFTYEGQPGHEIALIQACSLRDEHVYSLDQWDAHETLDGRGVTHNAWKSLSSFARDGDTLYPDGVTSLVLDL